MPRILQTPDNEYLDPIIYEATYKLEFLNTTYELPSLGPQDVYQNSSMYFKPFHAARAAEPLLRRALFGRWTSVSSDDELMRNIHLMHDWPWLVTFPKKDFLEKLIAERHDHCLCKRNSRLYMYMPLI